MLRSRRFAGSSSLQALAAPLVLRTPFLEVCLLTATSHRVPTALTPGAKCHARENEPQLKQDDATAELTLSTYKANEEAGPHLSIPALRKLPPKQENYPLPLLPLHMAPLQSHFSIAMLPHGITAPMLTTPCRGAMAFFQFPFLIAERQLSNTFFYCLITWE